MTMERLTTGDFIARLPFRSGAGRVLCESCRSGTDRGPVRLSIGRAQAYWKRPSCLLDAAWPACVRYGDRRCRPCQIRDTQIDVIPVRLVGKNCADMVTPEAANRVSTANRSKNAVRKPT